MDWRICRATSLLGIELRTARDVKRFKATKFIDLSISEQKALKHKHEKLCRHVVGTDCSEFSFPAFTDIDNAKEALYTAFGAHARTNLDRRVQWQTGSNRLEIFFAMMDERKAHSGSN